MLPMMSSEWKRLLDQSCASRKYSLRKMYTAFISVWLVVMQVRSSSNSFKTTQGLPGFLIWSSTWIVCENITRMLHSCWDSCSTRVGIPKFKNRHFRTEYMWTGFDVVLSTDEEAGGSAGGISCNCWYTERISEWVLRSFSEFIFLQVRMPFFRWKSFLFANLHILSFAREDRYDKCKSFSPGVEMVGTT